MRNHDIRDLKGVEKCQECIRKVLSGSKNRANFYINLLEKGVLIENTLPLDQLSTPRF